MRRQPWATPLQPARSASEGIPVGTYPCEEEFPCWRFGLVHQKMTHVPGAAHAFAHRHDQTVHGVRRHPAIHSTLALPPRLPNRFNRKFLHPHQFAGMFAGIRARHGAAPLPTIGSFHMHQVAVHGNHMTDSNIVEGVENLIVLRIARRFARRSAAR